MFTVFFFLLTVVHNYICSILVKITANDIYNNKKLKGADKNSSFSFEKKKIKTIPNTHTISSFLQILKQANLYLFKLQFAQREYQL